MSDREIPGSEHDAVPPWLAAEGPEVPMPPDVQTRVQAALADEAARRAAADESMVVPVPPQRAGRWLAAASVAALAVIGAAIVVPLLGGGDGDDSAASGTSIDSVESDTLGSSESGEAAWTESDSEEVPQRGVDSDTGAPTELALVPDSVLTILDDDAALAAPEGCGANLAAKVDAQVREAVLVPDGGGVLVVLAEPGADAAWWLSSCSALPEQALGRSVVP